MESARPLPVVASGRTLDWGRIGQVFNWPRETGTRDLRLDFLRGWCLFSMVIDHAVFGDGSESRQTFLLHFTGGGGYPMTGAHGFVFLSGCVFGLVYGRILLSEGWSKALPKALRRAGTLYLVAIALGFLGILYGVTPWGGGTSLQEALNADTIVPTLLLHGSNDSLMSFYFLMILLAPAALWAMQLGFTWLVVAVSLAFYVGHLLLPQHFGNPVEIFIPAAEWQVLFVAGLLIGYHRETLRRWFTGTRRTVYLVVLFMLFATLCVTQFLYLTGRSLGPAFDWLVGQVYTDYDNNPPLHFLAIFVAFFGLYQIVDWLWKPLSALLGWFLVPIGGAALYVYIVHSVIVYYILLNVPAFMAIQGTVLTLVLIALMLSLWFMVKRRFLFQVVPR